MPSGYKRKRKDVLNLKRLEPFHNDFGKLEMLPNA